jgi:hypothetical protein
MRVGAIRRISGRGGAGVGRELVKPANESTVAPFAEESRIEEVLHGDSALLHVEIPGSLNLYPRKAQSRTFEKLASYVQNDRLQTAGKHNGLTVGAGAGVGACAADAR